eukprot:395234-Hanusia_phi.AAC.1
MASDSIRVMPGMMAHHVWTGRAAAPVTGAGGGSLRRGRSSLGLQPGTEVPPRVPAHRAYHGIMILGQAVVRPYGHFKP